MSRSHRALFSVRTRISRAAYARTKARTAVRYRSARPGWRFTGYGLAIPRITYETNSLLNRPAVWSCRFPVRRKTHSIIRSPDCAVAFRSVDVTRRSIVTQLLLPAVPVSQSCAIHTTTKTIPATPVPALRHFCNTNLEYLEPKIISENNILLHLLQFFLLRGFRHPNFGLKLTFKILLFLSFRNKKCVA